jgi:hypothetical protein
MDGSGVAAMAGGKKLRKASARTIRAAVRKAGLKPKSGRVVIKGGAASALTPGAVGGKKTRRRTRRHRGLGKLFGY